MFETLACVYFDVCRATVIISVKLPELERWKLTLSRNQCEIDARIYQDGGGRGKRKEGKNWNTSACKPRTGINKKSCPSFVLAIIELAGGGPLGSFLSSWYERVCSSRRSDCRKFNILGGQSLRWMLTMAFKREKERTFPLLRRWLLTYDRNFPVFEISEFLYKISRPIPRLFRRRGNDTWEKYESTRRRNIRSNATSIFFVTLVVKIIRSQCGLYNGCCFFKLLDFAESEWFHNWTTKFLPRLNLLRWNDARRDNFLSQIWQRFLSFKYI